MASKVDMFLKGCNSDIPEFALFWFPLHISIYRTRAIITHGLYVLNSLFERQKRLWPYVCYYSRVGYDGARTVFDFTGRKP